MKITLNNKEEIELTERFKQFHKKQIKNFVREMLHLIVWIVGFSIISALLVLYCLIAGTCNPVSAQSTKTVYRQTLIIKSGKPIEVITWQKITVIIIKEVYD